MRILTLTATTLAVLASTAHAEDEVADDDPGFNMLAIDMSTGALPVDGAHTRVMSLGLGIEHPVFRVTRVFGEYDWLWLMRQDAMSTVERHGTGHRISLGLRRELTAKGTSAFRMFLDGEIGATFALANDNITGVTTLPGAFAGVRAGYDAYTSREDSPSRTLEISLVLRAVGLVSGIGVTGGLAIAWGS